MVLRRSIRMVEPRLFFCPAPRFSQVPECYLFAEVGEYAASTPPVVRSSAGGSGLFSLHRAAPVRPGPAAARSLAGYPTGSGPPGHAFNAPKRFTRHVTRRLLCGPVAASVSGSFLARSVVPTRPKIRAETPFTRGPKAWRSGQFWNPCGSDRRDPNTLAPNRLEARPCPSRPSRTSTSF